MSNARRFSILFTQVLCLIALEVGAQNVSQEEGKRQTTAPSTASGSASSTPAPNLSSEQSGKKVAGAGVDPTEWAMREIGRAEYLVTPIFIVGAIVVAVVTIFDVQFYVWHRQHQKMLLRVKEWERSLEKAKSQMISIAQDLRLPALLDLKLDEPKRLMAEWISRTCNKRGLSIEQIDEWARVLRVFCDPVPEAFLSLGTIIDIWVTRAKHRTKRMLSGSLTLRSLDMRMR